MIFFIISITYLVIVLFLKIKIEKYILIMENLFYINNLLIKNMMFLDIYFSTFYFFYLY